eukprot:GHVT01063474.1.p1 GENE.GHVT01063474.1~~GHVT01063474.1.p1  ORF type:complete len:591 (-),score=103.53 GHVT01063474.1:785-2440(-)
MENPFAVLLERDEIRYGPKPNTPGYYAHLGRAASNHARRHPPHTRTPKSKRPHTARRSKRIRTSSAGDAYSQHKPKSKRHRTDPRENTRDTTPKHSPAGDTDYPDQDKPSANKQPHAHTIDPKLNFVDHIWAFKGTGNPKTWVLNGMGELVRNAELCLSGRLHEGFDLLLRTAFLPEMRKYVARLKEMFDDDSAGSSEFRGSSPSSSSSASASHGDSTPKPSIKYSADRPLIVAFTGHSLGGAMAQLCAMYVANALSTWKKPSIIITAVTFGAPTFGDTALYQSLYSSGVILYDVCTDVDPITRLFAVPKLNSYADPKDKLFAFTIPSADMSNIRFGPSKGRPTYSGKIWTNSDYRPTDRRLYWISRLLTFKKLRDYPLVDPVGTHYIMYFAALSLLAGMTDEAEFGSFLSWPIAGPAYKALIFSSDMLNVCHDAERTVLPEMMERVARDETAFRSLRQSLSAYLFRTHRKHRANNRLEVNPQDLKGYSANSFQRAKRDCHSGNGDSQQHSNKNAAAASSGSNGASNEREGNDLAVVNAQSNHSQSPAIAA